MSTTEGKWLNKYAKIGCAYNPEFARFNKSKKIEENIFLVKCKECSWMPDTDSAIEPDVHSFLTGHTIQMIRIKEFKRQILTVNEPDRF